MKKIQNPNAYAEKALLTKIRISAWTGKAKAKRVDNLATETFGASRGSTRTSKALIADEPTWTRLVKAGRDAKRLWEEWSSPWQDGGIRMIAASSFMAFGKRVENAIEEFNDAADAFADAYEAIVPRQADRLKGLFDPQNYPSPGDVRRRFKIVCDYFPVPTSDDFRCELVDDQMDKLRKSTEDAVAVSLERASRDPWDRLMTVLKTMSATLSDPDKTFRDSLFENVSALVEMIPALNMFGNEDLDKIAAQVREQICSVDPDAVRDPKSRRSSYAELARSSDAQAKRTEVKAKADGIIAKMESLGL